MKLYRVGNGCRWSGVGLLAVGHGFGDFNAGVLLAILGDRSGADLVTLYLLYNVLAFAGQPFAGLICDRLGRTSAWFTFGGVLSALSLALAWWRPEAAVICSGIASAFYHSAGGAAAWALGDKRTLAAGVFAAPGVVGLALGLAFGGQLSPAQILVSGSGLLLVLFLLFGVLRGLDLGEHRSDKVRTVGFGLIGGVVGWLILTAIAARSFAWSVGQAAIFPPEYAVNLALAGAVGKATAAWLADRIGAARVTVTSLALAAVFFAVSEMGPWLFFPAVVALQASTGPMMALIFREWPRRPAFASGLAQGLAIALGGVPLLVLGRLGSSQVVAAVVALVTAFAMMWLVVIGCKKTGREA